MLSRKNRAGRIRTPNPLIWNQLLYHWSYCPIDFSLRSVAERNLRSDRFAGGLPACKPIRKLRPDRHFGEAETSPPGRREACAGEDATVGGRRAPPRQHHANPKGLGDYLMILATTPAPTVRPPSRIAKRRPSSMAIAWISSTLTLALSPGMHISAPSTSVLPVTSVVRK